MDKKNATGQRLLNWKRLQEGAQPYKEDRAIRPENLVRNFSQSEERLTKTIPTVYELISKHEYVENWWDGSSCELTCPNTLISKSACEIILYNKDGEKKYIRLRLVVA